MSIAVHYGSSGADRDSAEQIANYIDNNYNFSAFTVSGGSIAYSSFDGVIIVGGQTANQQYQKWVTEGEFPELLCNTGQDDPFYLGDSASEGVVTESFTHQGCVVQGLAGCTESNTESLSTWYIGQATAQQMPFNTLGAGVDDFIESVLENQSGEDETVEDPTDPIVEPEDPDSETELDPIRERFDNKLVVGVHPFATKKEASYEIRVSESMSSPIDAEAGEFVAAAQKVDGTATKPRLFSRGDLDTFYFDGKISDVASNTNLLLEVNGEQYKYNSDLDKVETTSGAFFQPRTSQSDKFAEDQKSEDFKESENQEEMSPWEKFIDSLLNPFDNPNNTARFAAMILLVLVALRGMGIIQDFTE